MSPFEHHREPLLPRRAYIARLVRSALVTGGIIATSLLIGVVGYHAFGKLSWLDALVNASMILGGMGPVDPIHSTAGKWFASAYALFSGITLLTSVGVLVAPAVHRFMHRFHLEEEGSDE